MEFNDLQKIGLTDGEIKVYKALLKLGESTKTTLAKESKVSPSNIYDITNRLLEKGMISKVEKNGVSNFSPANPKHILDYLEEKKKEIDKEKDYVSSILPLLLSKFNSTEEKVNVEVFSGWNGMKTVFEDMAEECAKGDKHFVFGASKGKNEEQVDNFFFQKTRTWSDKGVKTYIIFNKELRDHKRSNFLKKYNYEIRFIDQLTPAEVHVYKNRSLIIILTDSPLIIRITGKEVADSFKQYFDIMWKQAKA